MPPVPRYAWKPKARKFTADQIMELLSLFDSGEKVNFSALSRKYGVTQKVLKGIQIGETYKEERRIYEKQKREAKAAGHGRD